MAKKFTNKIVPDVTLFGKLGARSRAFPMVVTELIDNSLDSWEEMPSKFKGKDGLRIEIHASEKTAKDSRFIIKDNAGGMTKETLVKALTIAHSLKTNKANLIGNFGFGLKSACMYIGSEFDIYTQHHSSPDIVSHIHFNLKAFETQGTEWEISGNELSTHEAGKLHHVFFPYKHGTEIRIKNEKYRKASEDGIFKRVQRIFGPRLAKKSGTPKIAKLKNSYDDMHVFFNTKELFASGPFYEVFEPRKPALGEDPLDRNKGAQKEAALDPKYLSRLVNIPVTKISPTKTFWGVAGIIDRGMAHNNQYGFDLIKNGRVIETNVTDKDKDDLVVGLLNNNHSARVVGQLYMDDAAWKTDHQKTEFIKDDPDWAKVAEVVSEKIKHLAKESSNLQHPNKAKAGARDATKSAVTQMSQKEAPRIVASISKGAKSEMMKATLAKIDRDIVATGKPVSKVSNSKLISMRPEVNFVNLGEDEKAFRRYIKNSGKSIVIKIDVNCDHPALEKYHSGELTAIANLMAVEVYAAHIYKEKGSTNIDHLFDLQEAILKGN